MRATSESLHPSRLTKSRKFAASERNAFPMFAHRRTTSPSRPSERTVLLPTPLWNQHLNQSPCVRLLMLIRQRVVPPLDLNQDVSVGAGKPAEVAWLWPHSLQGEGRAGILPVFVVALSKLNYTTAHTPVCLEPHSQTEFAQKCGLAE